MPCSRSHGLGVSDKHREFIRELTEPTSGDVLIRLLSLVNFFAEFVDDLAEVAAPLYEILTESGFAIKPPATGFTGLESALRALQIKARQGLVDALVKLTVLAAAVRGRAAKLMTDASACTLPGVLHQLNQEHRWTLVSFTSRKMKRAEKSYAYPSRNEMSGLRPLFAKKEAVLA